MAALTAPGAWVHPRTHPKQRAAGAVTDQGQRQLLVEAGAVEALIGRLVGGEEVEKRFALKGIVGLAPASPRAAMITTVWKHIDALSSGSLRKPELKALQELAQFVESQSTAMKSIKEVEEQIRHYRMAFELTMVRQGHDKISGTFTHGEHEGQNRADLIEDLLSGKVRLVSETGVKIEKHQIC